LIYHHLASQYEWRTERGLSMQVRVDNWQMRSANGGRGDRAGLLVFIHFAQVVLIAALELPEFALVEAHENSAFAFLYRQLVKVPNF
jgi:hypothetical protein